MSDFIRDEDMQELERKGVARAPDFIPDDQMPPAPAPTTGGGNALQTGLETYGDVATLGYLPQLQALAEKALPDASGGVDAELEAQGFKIGQPGQNYINARDANRARLLALQAENPTAAAIGTGAGILGGGLLTPGMGAAAAGLKGVSLGSRAGLKALGGMAGQGAKMGAIQGALANPGDIEGEFSPLQLQERLEGAGTGAALGGALGGAIPAGGKLLSETGDWLKTKAAERAFKTLGLPTPTQAQKLTGSGENIEIGKMLLEEGAVPIFGTPKRVAARVEALQDKAGKEIGRLIDAAGDTKKIDAERLGIEILDSPWYAELQMTPGAESTVNAIAKQVETLAKNKTLSVKQAQKLRQNIDEQINYAKGAPELRGVQEGLYQQRRGLAQEMEKAVDALAPTKEAGKLRKANKKYSRLSEASEILDRELARGQKNRAISLTDTIAGAAGLGIGGQGGDVGEAAKMAAILALLNKGGRTFGPAMTARASQTAGKLVGKAGARAEAIDPVKAVAALQRLAQGPYFVDKKAKEKAKK